MKSQTGQPAPLRRQHDRAFKLELVRQSMAPGASVSAVALRGGVNANMLFRWRRELQPLGAQACDVALVPVQMVAHKRPVGELGAGLGAASLLPPMQLRKSPPPPPQGTIELDVDGVLVRLNGIVDEPNLCSVLRALRRSA